MEKFTIFCITIITFTGTIYSCTSQERSPNFGKIALENSRIPVRPGKPGKVPFWNKYSKRFIYAPAFDYNTIKSADKYRYEIVSLSDSSTYQFESDISYAPLSPVWTKVPVGRFKIKVIGISSRGDSLGLAGKGRYYRASPFDPPSDDVYHKPVMPYDSSAMLALDSLLHKDYVNYWLVHKAPDPDYKLYRYPAKIMSALIVGAVTYTRLTTNVDESNRSKKIAMIVADYLMSISEPEGSPLAYFPPTYHGYQSMFTSESHMKYNHTMMIYAVKAGLAYLDLYELTNQEKYLVAAKRIAQTYLRRQRANGTWYLFVNNETGNPVAQNMTIPTGIINYFDRLRESYKMKGLKRATKKALHWTMTHPVTNFNWQGQFEDVGPTPAYKDQSREQACDLAIYLFKSNKNIALAEELVRFAEDQFVIWEKPMDIQVREGSKGHYSKNWITPSVQEQSNYWMPVTRSAGIMIDTYWHAYKATNKGIYLAKAKSIANSLTLVQRIYSGNYPTYFTKKQYPMNVWINNIVWPAKVMMTFEENLKGLD